MTMRRAERAIFYVLLAAVLTLTALRMSGACEPRRPVRITRGQSP